jgi:pimeloyl-[acyl-carrier protein] methyl ester esterase
MKQAPIKIMVLNGWAASSHAWDLCRFMQVKSLDCEKASLYSYVDQLNERPEEAFRCDGRFVLVGWSMGGSTALRLACKYPEQIVGLVLVATTPRMMENRDEGWRGMSPRRLDALRKGLELTHGQGFFGVSDDRPNPYMVDKAENLERGLKYLLDTDVRAEIRRVFENGCKFPVHILQSEQDGIVRSSNAVWLKEAFPDAELTMVKGSEHAISVSNPELIDRAVNSVISSYGMCFL